MLQFRVSSARRTIRVLAGLAPQKRKEAVQPSFVAGTWSNLSTSSVSSLALAAKKLVMNTACLGFLRKSKSTRLLAVVAPRTFVTPAPPRMRRRQQPLAAVSVSTASNKYKPKFRSKYSCKRGTFRYWGLWTTPCKPVACELNTGVPSVTVVNSMCVCALCYLADFQRFDCLAISLHVSFRSAYRLLQCVAVPELNVCSGARS